jgi:allophanate hydrolase subunit 2
VSGEINLRVVAGPQRPSFTDTGIATFLSSAYTVSDKSDRQGLRLDGPVIEGSGGEYDIVSDAVVFGSVQVPGDGKPIVLMADRQTTGGYTKIATVASVDLPLLAQATPGTTLKFVEISVTEAQSRMRERRDAILNADIRSGICAGKQAIVVDGTVYEIDIQFRQTDIGQSNGGMATVSLPGERFTARVNESPDSSAR